MTSLPTATTETKVTVLVSNPLHHCLCPKCRTKFARTPKKKPAVHMCPRCRVPARVLLFTCNSIFQ